MQTLWQIKNREPRTTSRQITSDADKRVSIQLLTCEEIMAEVCKKYFNNKKKKKANIRSQNAKRNQITLRRREKKSFPRSAGGFAIVAHWVIIIFCHYEADRSFPPPCRAKVFY